MDAILERVQNKFACIIGELCSEPVVLSKFAIWLDLRLAEYKAKGAISLDCSGESPDPVWLKGHEVQTVKRTDDAYSAQSLSRSALTGSKSFQKTRPPEPVVYEGNPPDDPLSPGVVLIKEEVTEDEPDVFPISIHRIQPSSQNSRKRPLQDSVARSRDSFSNSSPSKIRHMEDSSISATDNQSLMSIIQDSDDLDDHHSSSMTDNDFRTLISSHQAGSAIQSRGDNSLTFSPQASSTAAHYSSSPSVSTEDSSSIQHAVSFQSPPGELSLSQDTGQGTGYHGMMTQAMLARRRTTFEHIRSRIDNIGDKSYVTVKHLVGSMATLETWLQVKGEHRCTEDIPPEELDPFLEDFFSTIKKLDGGDYDPTSFACLRSYIERFLIDKGYRFSLRKSSVFARSHHAFQVRRKTLPVKSKR